MTEEEMADAIAAVSLRMVAFENAIQALALSSSIDRERFAVEYDTFGQATRDQYVTLPVDDTVISLLDQSHSDIRMLVFGSKSESASAKLPLP